MAKLPETMELMLSNSSPDAKVWSVLCFILPYMNQLPDKFMGILPHPLNI